MKVWIIDDSVTIRAMMVRVLEADPEIQTVSAASVDEAEAALATERFDLATLDVVMPGRGGLDFVRPLIERYGVPVIMLSASTGAGALARAQALNEGAAACFDKADAVRAAPALIRLVKRVAAGRSRIGADDRAAIARVAEAG